MNHNRGRNGQRVGGFTLLELHVVIGLMGVLIALAVPGLSKARTSAKDAECLTRLRSLFVAHVTYLHDFERFPKMNKEDDDGNWQYNYLIFNGKENGLLGDQGAKRGKGVDVLFEHNFGPLMRYTKDIDDVQHTLFCPVQEDPYHSFGTPFNRWPVVVGMDLKAGYGRRYHLSGKTLGQIGRTIGMAADVFHLPRMVKSGHKTGVNAVYTDGHGRWVKDSGDLADNDLSDPFDRVGNAIIKDLWEKVDGAQ